MQDKSNAIFIISDFDARLKTANSNFKKALAELKELGVDIEYKANTTNFFELLNRSLEPVVKFQSHVFHD